MKRTLGMDLGSNSLGWAILDDVTGDIVDKGVLVFPEGVDPDAGTSVETPAAARRAARMGRRMKFRRKLRKWNLLKILIEAKMCPLANEDLDAWKKCGRYPVGNKEFIAWLKATDSDNPYCDRAAAVEGKVEPFVLGRALYHIAQRRGFKSSRKEEAALVDEETGEIKAPDKKLGAVKSDIAALSAEIEAAGCKTLGQYFFKRLEAEKGTIAKSRIRGRYTGRVEHYMSEFSAMMDAQGIAPESKLRADLYKAIFKQRPLRSQKHLVGKCPLEPKYPRVQIGHPAFEEFRMLAFVNNLSLEDECGEYRDEDGNLLYPLSQEDRELICSAFMKKAPTFKFSAISKLFKKDSRFKNKNLRFHYYSDADSVPSCSTRHRIRSAFGEVPYDEQKVFDALTFFDDTEKLKEWFKKHFEALDGVAVAQLASIHPKEGNAKYSLKAIKKMLPFLRKGMELSQARFFAKLPDLIPGFFEHEEEIRDNLNALAWECKADRRRYAELDEKERKTTPRPLPLEERYKEYFLNDWNITEDKFALLYRKDDSAYVPETEYRCKGEKVKLEKPRLPPVELGMIRNPLVQRSMTTLRRLVNYLGDHGKIDVDDTIRIELARTVNDFATRKAWQAWQNSRRKLREEAVAEIAAIGVKVTEDAIDRYVLWKEQDGRCLYTGKNIKLSDLFAGNAFDIEHTVPRSLSGDDSLANKTICDAVYNREVKKGRVPRDCPNRDEINVLLGGWRKKVVRLEKDFKNQSRSASGKTDPAAKSQARVKALVTRMELNYWRDKVKRFDVDPAKITAKDEGIGGFKKRQLVDTGIMCSHAVELLKCLYPKTYAVNGAATAFARKAWGIQGDGAKDRTEHIHHAKDAMVIAALTPKRFTAICSALKDDAGERRRECDVCPKPYDGFEEKVRKACDEILVKHILRQTTLRQSSKRNALAHAHKEKGDPNGKTVKYVLSKGDTVRGQLHKESFYGCICMPEERDKVFVERVKIAGEAVDDVLKFVDNIVDPTIRRIVSDRLGELKRLGVKNVEAGSITMASGISVNKVRVTVRLKDPMSIRRHSHCSTKEYKNFVYAATGQGANFRLALLKDENGVRAVSENTLQWAQNHKRPDYEPLDEKTGFMGYVYPGSMALALQFKGENITECPVSELRKRLYVVLSIGSEKDNRAQFRHALLAGQKKELGALANDFSIGTPPGLIRMTPAKYLSQMLFEGIHFKMMLDGSIEFIKR